MTPEKPQRPFAIIGSGSIFDGMAYWATLAGLYLMVGGLMFYSGNDKLFDDNGNAPQAIKTQVAGTVIDYDASNPHCAGVSYSAGSTIVDIGGSDVHMLRNEGTMPAETIAVQFIPSGQPRKVSAPEPAGCTIP